MPSTGQGADVRPNGNEQGAQLEGAAHEVPPLVSRHASEIKSIRERVFRLQDRQLQLEALRDATLDHARAYYRNHPEALERIEKALGYIFEKPTAPSFIFNAPRRIGQLLTTTPCVFTFLPGVVNHQSIPQHEVVMQGRYTTVHSRRNIDLASTLARGLQSPGGPFLPAPMRGVIGPQLVEAMIEEGLVPIMHRFRAPTNPDDVDTDNPSVQSAAEADAVKVALVRRFGQRLFVSCGVTERSVDFGKELLRQGAGGILIDTAIGNGDQCVAATIELRQFRERIGSKAIIFAGNVDNDEGYFALTLAGADMVRVGIGPGSPCTTRIVTRAGFGQGSALMSVGRAAFVYGRNSTAPTYIADGGISNSADVLAAIELGASGAMLGRYFAATHESGGLKKTINGQPHVWYFGEASRWARLYEDGGMRPGTTAEGEGRWIKVQGSLSERLAELRAGMTNALPYYNATTPAALAAKVSIPQQLCDLILGQSTGINLASSGLPTESGTQLK